MPMEHVVYTTAIKGTSLRHRQLWKIHWTTSTGDRVAAEADEGSSNSASHFCSTVADKNTSAGVPAWN